MNAGAALRRKRPAKRATYRDVLDAPAHMVAEIVEGALHLQPRPAGRHTLAGSSLGVEIGGPFQRGRGGPGGWWILDEPELHFGEDILVPDLAGWRRERMPTVPDDAWFTLAPDWVCEILSPSTRKFDLEEKRPIYAREGIGHLWLVEPSARTLEAFRLADGDWSAAGSASDAEPVSFPPFDAVSFPLDALWP
ncbi:MAG: Uma2 family endonuclease [Alphaproteobacteria bacterium]|nr:Uma2 family endonuclease [Alphaproteobacteria bacterium]